MEQTRSSHNGHSAVSPLSRNFLRLQQGQGATVGFKRQSHRHIIKQRPVAVLLGAVCLGFIVHASSSVEVEEKATSGKDNTPFRCR